MKGKKKKIVSSPLPVGEAEVRASWREAREAILGFTSTPDLGAEVGKVALRWWVEGVKEGDLLFGKGEAAPELRALQGAALAASFQLEVVRGLSPIEGEAIYEGTRKLPRVLEEALEGREDLLEVLEAVGLGVGVFYDPREGLKALEDRTRALLRAHLGRAMEAPIPSPWEGEGASLLPWALEEALVKRGILSVTEVGGETPHPLAKEGAALLTRVYRALTASRTVGLVARDREGQIRLRWGRAWRE